MDPDVKCREPFVSTQTETDAVDSFRKGFDHGGHDAVMLSGMYVPLALKRSGGAHILPARMPEVVEVLVAGPATLRSKGDHLKGLLSELRDFAANPPGSGPPHQSGGTA